MNPEREKALIHFAKAEESAGSRHSPLRRANEEHSAVTAANQSQLLETDLWRDSGSSASPLATLSFLHIITPPPASCPLSSAVSR